MAKSLLDDRTLLPAFHLLGRQAQEFDSLSFKRKKNLIVFFVTVPTKEFLFALEEAGPALSQGNAEVVVICPLPVAALEELCRGHRIASMVLSDPACETLRRFIQMKEDESVAALFITDRFGEIFFQYVVADVSGLPPFDDVVKSLDFIESQSPECGGGL